LYNRKVHKSSRKIKIQCRSFILEFNFALKEAINNIILLRLTMLKVL
jgi:hypothetical protein